jgi:hypothetical protein
LRPPDRCSAAGSSSAPAVQAGGNGRKTDQLNGVFNFTYSFDNGWTVGIQPKLSIDWEAP